jgi:hypothetical protein
MFEFQELIGHKIYLLILNMLYQILEAPPLPLLPWPKGRGELGVGRAKKMG